MIIQKNKKNMKISNNLQIQTLGCDPTQLILCIWPDMELNACLLESRSTFPLQTTGTHGKG